MKTIKITTQDIYKLNPNVHLIMYIGNKHSNKILEFFLNGIKSGNEFTLQRTTLAILKQTTCKEIKDLENYLNSFNFKKKAINDSVASMIDLKYKIEAILRSYIEDNITYIIEEVKFENDQCLITIKVAK